MTVKELIEKLNTMDSESQVLVQFMNGDAYGSAWEDLEYFDECDIKVTGHKNSWTHKVAALNGQKNIRVYVEGPYTMMKRKTMRFRYFSNNGVILSGLWHSSLRTCPT